MPSSEVLEGLAANEALAIDVVRPLIGGDDLAVVVALARRWDLSQADATLLAAHPVMPVRQSLAKNAYAALLVGADLAEDADVAVRLALASGDSTEERPVPPLPEPVQQRLARDDDGEVRRRLAWRQDLSVAVRCALATDPSADVRASMNPIGLPDDVVRRLHTDPDPTVRASALIVAPSRELVPDLLASEHTRAAAARTGQLTAEEVTLLVVDPDSWVREGVARNVTVPVALLRPLVDDPDEDVRRAMMLRGDITDELRRQLRVTVEPFDYEVADWLRPDAASLAQRLSYVDSQLVFCRRAVAFSLDLPADAVLRLVDTPDCSVRLLAAERYDNVPGPVIANLVRDAGHARWVLVRHPNMPVEALVAMAASPDSDRRRLAAYAPALPPDLVRRLTEDPDLETRRHAAQNPALPTEDLLRLLENENSYVAWAAARNPRLPESAARRLVAASSSAGFGVGENAGEHP